MRYKRVIPMVADEEAKEREKQLKKEEEEKRLSEEVGEECKESVSKVEINESKDRVYEHFKQISQTIIMDNQALPEEKKKKPKQLILGQMHGRKRKRGSNIAKEHKNQDDSSNTSKFSTPIPSLDTRVVHMSNNAKRKARQAIEERKLQQNLVQIQDNSEITPIR